MLSFLAIEARLQLGDRVLGEDQRVVVENVVDVGARGRHHIDAHQVASGLGEIIVHRIAVDHEDLAVEARLVEVTLEGKISHEQNFLPLISMIDLLPCDDLRDIPSCDRGALKDYIFCVVRGNFIMITYRDDRNAHYALYDLNCDDVRRDVHRGVHGYDDVLLK